MNACCISEGESNARIQYESKATESRHLGRLEKALSNEADVVYPPCANSLSVVLGITSAWNLIRIPSRQYSRWCPNTNSKYD